MKKVLVIGPTMLDVNVRLGKVGKYRPQTSYSIGGKGYNVAHTLGLFNVPTVLATMYGQDEIGSYLKECIQKNGIEVLPTNKVNHPSSIFVGVHDDAGETVFDKADTDIFDKQKLPNINYKNVSMILIVSSTASYILNHLRVVKIKNPEILFGLEISGSKTIEHIFPYLDIFTFLICNKKEAERLGEVMDMHGNLERIMQGLLERGMQEVIFTTDRDGLIGGKLENKVPVFYRSSVQKVPGNIISTVGAGDSVTAAFMASFYCFHKEFKESIDIAMRVAAISVRTKDPFPKKLPQRLIKAVTIKI